jgi:hypothetical protein
MLFWLYEANTDGENDELGNKVKKDDTVLYFCVIFGAAEL